MASSLLLLFYTVNTFCLYVYICLGLTFLLIAFASLLHYLFCLYGFFSEGLLIVKCFQSLSENVFFCLTFVFCYHQFRMCWHEFLPFQPVWGSLNFLKYLCLLSNLESFSPLFLQGFSAPYSSSSPFRSLMTVMLDLLFLSSRSQDSVSVHFHLPSFFSLCIRLDDF